MTNIEKLNMNIDQVNSDFVAIKNKITEYGVKVAENTPTTEYASKVAEVYDKGKHAEWDVFWDAFQDNGNRKAYNNAFNNTWTAEIFKPKYPIRVVGDASYMFDSCKIGNQETPDFDFVENGVILDTSGATSLTYMFRNCKGIKRVGTIDCTSITKDINRTFYYCKVITIDKLVVKETLKYDSPFASTSNLENITIEGIIGNNISFGDCTKLTKDSLLSIIAALKNDVSGLTCTLGTTNLAKLTDAEKAIATQKGWTLT